MFLNYIFSQVAKKFKGRFIAYFLLTVWIYYLGKSLIFKFLSAPLTMFLKSSSLKQ